MGGLNSPVSPGRRRRACPDRARRTFGRCQRAVRANWSGTPANMPATKGSMGPLGGYMLRHNGTKSRDVRTTSAGIPQGITHGRENAYLLGVVGVVPAPVALDVVHTP